MAVAVTRAPVRPFARPRSHTGLWSWISTVDPKRISFLFGGAPDGGWFGYAPNTLAPFSVGHRIDFWLIGLVVTGVGSLTAAVNFIVTTLNLRAPVMTFMRMPVFVWMNLVVSFLLLFAMPVITVALFELYFDRNFGANFFNANIGGDPVLWQHMFWFFVPPQAYILIPPALR